MSAAVPWQPGAAIFGAIVGFGLLASACGGTSPSASVAQLGTTTTSRPAKGSSNDNGNGSPLAYAQCMRAHGVPDFPDPNSQGGFALQGGPNSDLSPNSSAFQQANEDCQRFTPTSGLGHGPSPAQVAQAQAQALKFSQCMRSHGIADFPDPVFHSGGGVGSASLSRRGREATSPPTRQRSRPPRRRAKSCSPARRGPLCHPRTFRPGRPIRGRRQR